MLKAIATPTPALRRPRPVRAWLHRRRAELPGYREEDDVDPNSEHRDVCRRPAPFVDNWRWADTPFYVRVGKRLPRRETTIAIQFKRAPHPPFEAVEELRPNVLFVHIQPNEGVSLALGAKVPGWGMHVRTVHMDFLYGGAFRMGLPEAYERLILDAMLGDADPLHASDEIEEQWSLVDAIVAAWGATSGPSSRTIRRHMGPVGRRRSWSDGTGELDPCRGLGRRVHDDRGDRGCAHRPGFRVGFVGLPEPADDAC